MPVTDKDREFASALCSRLTLEEKIGQMCQIDGRYDQDLWIMERSVGSVLHVVGSEVAKLRRKAADSRMGIPLLFGIDAIHGHAFHDGATVFPVQLGLASSFNPDLMREIGTCVAGEVLATGLDWTFSPVLCLGRDPRWGRLSETFGEDPFLAGKLGEALITGYQQPTAGRVMIACAKHFIGYGESVGARDSADTSVSKRKVKELFLPPFRAAVDAGCMSLMIGYQSLDGIPCTASEWLIRDVLIGELGFTGIIITDWDNVGRMHREQFYVPDLRSAVEKAIRTGCSMIMATPEFYQEAISLCREKSDLLPYVDEAVVRNLSVKKATGLFDCETGTECSFSPNTELAYKSSLESIVLLKNGDNGERVLPLQEDAVVLLAGPQANNIFNQLGEWSFGPQEFTHKTRRPYHRSTATLLSEIKRQSISAVHVPGWEEITDGFDRSVPVSEEAALYTQEAVARAHGCSYMIIAVGDSFEMNGECLDRSDLSLTKDQMYLASELKRRCPEKPLIAVVIGGKPIVEESFYQVCDAVLYGWNPGMQGGKALWDVMFGRKNPSGKLPVTIPRNLGQLPVYYNHLPGWHAQKYIDSEQGPAFRFGFGLSYTEFELNGVSLSQAFISIEDLRTKGITVTAAIKNVGSMSGQQVLQCYIHDSSASVIQPVLRLVGVRKVYLEPGDEIDIRLVLDYESFSLVDESLKRIAESGVFIVYVGFSSDISDCRKMMLSVR